MIRKILLCLAVMSSIPLESSVFIYAPGVAPPWGGHDKAVRDACRSVKNLRIFSPDANLESQIDADVRIATITDAEKTHIVYVPLFVDFCNGTGLRDRYIAQERDIADLYYVHAYACMYHDGPIHMIGHSRGGGTISAYTGLLWYDRSYLHDMAQQHWPQREDARLCDMHTVDERVMSQIGALCMIGAFDNLGETVQNVIHALHMPEFVQRYIMEDPQSLYHRISSMIPTPQYNWETEVTPRAMAAYIPVHVPCLCVHTDRDPINPPAVAYDIHATRKAIAPDRSYLHIIANTMTLPFRHIEIPYFREMPDVSISLWKAVNMIECEYTRES